MINRRVGNKMNIIDISRIINDLANNNVQSLDLRNTQIIDYSKKPKKDIIKIAFDLPDGYILYNAIIPHNQPNQYVITACHKYIAIWDTLKRMCLRIIQGHTDKINAILPISYDRILSSSNDGTVRLWQCETGDYLGTILDQEASVDSMLMISEDWLATGNSDGTISIWNIKLCQQLIEKYSGHKGSITSLSMLNNKYLLSTSLDCTAMLWELVSGKCSKKYQHNQAIHSALITPDRSPYQCFITGGADGTIYYWDIDNNSKPYRTLKIHNDIVRNIIVLQDGNYASSSADGSICILKARTGRILQVIYQPTCQPGIALLPNGCLVSTGVSRRNEGLYLWTFPKRALNKEDVELFNYLCNRNPLFREIIYDKKW